MTAKKESAFDDRGDLARAKRFARMWLQLTLVAWGMSAIVSLLWWSAQVNELTVGPNTSFKAGSMFPWYIVVPGVPLGCYTAVRAVRTWLRYRTLKERSGPLGGV